MALQSRAQQVENHPEGDRGEKALFQIADHTEDPETLQDNAKLFFFF